jgi:hypothetical protein
MGALTDFVAKGAQVDAICTLSSGESAYLSRRGVPCTPAGLVEHDAIILRPKASGASGGKLLKPRYDLEAVNVQQSLPDRLSRRQA